MICLDIAEHSTLPFLLLNRYHFWVLGCNASSRSDQAWRALQLAIRQAGTSPCISPGSWPHVYYLVPASFGTLAVKPYAPCWHGLVCNTTRTAVRIRFYQVVGRVVRLHATFTTLLAQLRPGATGCYCRLQSDHLFTDQTVMLTPCCTRIFRKCGWL